MKSKNNELANKNEYEQKSTNLNYMENPLEWIRASSSSESFN